MPVPQPISHTIRADISCFKLKGEDFHSIQTTERVKAIVDGDEIDTTYALVAIFDGHGGKKAAEYSSKQLHRKLCWTVQEKLQETVDGLSSREYTCSDTVPDQEKKMWQVQDAIARAAPCALRDAFIQVNADVLDKGWDSGTTATVAIICGGHIVTANVGDSMAFIDVGAQVQQLTSTHRLDDNVNEQKRIKASGGELGQAAIEGAAVGPMRVWPGGLAFSRSLGDRKAGAIVLSEPEISHVWINKDGARVIMASDGVWDVIPGKNAAHRIRNLPCTKAAPRLRSAAKDLSDRDDITVIVVDVVGTSCDRIPSALSHKGAPGACTSISLWHPLVDCDRWHSVLHQVADSRRLWHKEVHANMDQDLAEMSAQVSSIEAPEPSDSSACALPAALYEEVRSMQKSLQASTAVDTDWVTVPSRNSSVVGQLSSTCDVVSGQSQHEHVDRVREKEFVSTDAVTQRGRRGRHGRRGRGPGRGRRQSHSAGAQDEFHGNHENHDARSHVQHGRSARRGRRKQELGRKAQDFSGNCSNPENLPEIPVNQRASEGVHVKGYDSRKGHSPNNLRGSLNDSCSSRQSVNGRYRERGSAQRQVGQPCDNVCGSQEQKVHKFKADESTSTNGKIMSRRGGRGRHKNRDFCGRGRLMSNSVQMQPVMVVEN